MNIEELDYNEVIKLIIKEFKGVRNDNTGYGMFTDGFNSEYYYILENEILNFRIRFLSSNKRYSLELIENEDLTKTYQLIDKETHQSVFITSTFVKDEVFYVIDEIFLSKPEQVTVYKRK